MVPASSPADRADSTRPIRAASGTSQPIRAGGAAVAVSRILERTLFLLWSVVEHILEGEKNV